MRSFFRKKGGERGSASVATETRGTILVVDDSPTEVRIYVNALVRAGYRVETAPNGEEGVQAAHRVHPDLILMDVVMPVLNGFQATRQLQRDLSTSNIPIIMVTTKDQDTDRAWALRQGALDYLIKPVDAEDLVERIRTALGG
ncbi:MAG: response regulator [Pseudomonadota bacterium]|nr:response regulator [Pseudomonadota bacterium]